MPKGQMWNQIQCKDWKGLTAILLVSPVWAVSDVVAPVFSWDTLTTGTCHLMAWACGPSCEGGKIFLYNYCQTQTSPLTFTKYEWGYLKAKAGRVNMEHKVQRVTRSSTQLFQGRGLTMQEQRYFYQDAIKMP